MEESYRRELLEYINDVADLLTNVDDFSVPGLGDWDLRGLVGHFTRAIRTPLTYLEEPQPDGPALPGAAHYIASYLSLRTEDPTSMDSRVAKRGRSEISDDVQHPGQLLRAEAIRLDRALATTSPERLIATPFGSLRFGDYMRTRTLELTVHGLDIARALGVDWKPPAERIADAVNLLGEVAVLQGIGSELLLALTGRTPPDPGVVLPVLR